MSDPKCPECGREMLVPVYRDYLNKTWIACCRCNECVAKWKTRDFTGETKEEAAEKARAAACRRQPNKPLTIEQFNAIYSMREDHVWPFDAAPPMLFLESAIEKLDFCWISWSVASDLLMNGYRAYSADNYGEKWRCWTQKPTDEERKAAPWEV